jgi:GH15 family glucan-1,4-alpha-glucosidase
MTIAPTDNLDLALVGNCAIGALVDRGARIVWCCLPAFDGDPWFSSLLGGDNPESGFFAVELDGLRETEQSYRINSGVLVTVLRAADGSAIEVVDCAPRFKQFNRSFRPTMLVRRLRPLAGTPRVRILLRPTTDWGASRPQVTRGSNHARFVGEQFTLRLNSSVPIGYVLGERWFLLERDEHLILGPDESLADSIEATSQRLIDETDHYWRVWVRSLSIPFEWQDAVIRAAIALKMCSFEETGAIVAALTTSIPEAPGSGRNWDYRYCWLRDAFFVVSALNRLGATRTMEGFLRYIMNIASAGEDGYLQPVFGIDLETRLGERTIATLPGYRGMGPVRVGNQAYQQEQNDGYGSAILTAVQFFFDRRFVAPGDPALFRRLEMLGEQARRRFDQPDAGPWEFRGRRRIHTFSSLMCWAACDRLARIARHLGLADRAAFWAGEAAGIAATIGRRSWNATRGHFVDSFEGEALDASLLLMPQLGFISVDDPRFRFTVAAIERELRQGDYLFRYRGPDDFGVPETAFNICTF